MEYGKRGCTIYGDNNLNAPCIADRTRKHQCSSIFLSSDTDSTPLTFL